jgi:hypothetical protein
LVVSELGASNKPLFNKKFVKPWLIPTSIFNKVPANEKKKI